MQEEHIGADLQELTNSGFTARRFAAAGRDARGDGLILTHRVKIEEAAGGKLEPVSIKALAELLPHPMFPDPILDFELHARIGHLLVPYEGLIIRCIGCTDNRHDASLKLVVEAEKRAS